MESATTNKQTSRQSKEEASQGGYAGPVSGSIARDIMGLTSPRCGTWGERGRNGRTQGVCGGSIRPLKSGEEGAEEGGNGVGAARRQRTCKRRSVR